MYTFCKEEWICSLSEFAFGNILEAVISLDQVFVELYLDPAHSPDCGLESILL